jgi:hypothetical protein
MVGRSRGGSSFIGGATGGRGASTVASLPLILREDSQGLIKKKDTRVHDYRKELVYTINLLILQEGNTRIFLPNLLLIFLPNPPSNFL